MKIDDAKQIPLQEIVEAFGGRLARKGAHGELWYYSPFRNEKSASFKIDTKRNIWKDFGHSLPGGDVLDFWLDYHGHNRRDSFAIKDALKDLDRFSTLPRVTIDRTPAPREYSETFKLIKPPQKIWHKNLVNELDRRKLTGYGLQQAYLENTINKKKYNGFCWENINGGLEVSIPDPYSMKSFKNCIGPKGITVMPVRDATQCVMVEGFFDYDTYQQMNNQKPTDFIILNGTGQIQQAINYLAGREQLELVITCLDNDDAGEKCEGILINALSDMGRRHGNQNYIYSAIDPSTGKPYKDINEWWMKEPGASSFRFPKSKGPDVTSGHQPNRIPKPRI